jgi:hypothetical protein
MVRKVFLWLLWIGFIFYVLFLAPPLHWQATLTLLKNLLMLQLSEINPIITSLFALIGVCISIYSCVLFFDGRMQKIPFYPFAIASLGTGIIALIPYLALRESNREFAGEKDAFLELLDSRLTGVFLTLFTLALLGYGLLLGDWQNYVEQFQSDRFINGMSLAFCLFCLLFPTVLGDDLARRNYLSDSFLFWLIAIIPLFGSLAYLCLRPPLRTRSLNAS